MEVGAQGTVVGDGDKPLPGLPQHLAAEAHVSHVRRHLTLLGDAFEWDRERTGLRQELQLSLQILIQLRNKNQRLEWSSSIFKQQKRSDAEKKKEVVSDSYLNAPFPLVIVNKLI